MPPITSQQLLAEFEDLIRTMPDHTTTYEDKIAWAGRASALVEIWSPSKSIFLADAIDKMNSGRIIYESDARRKVLTTIQQARHQLRLQEVGPLTVALSKGGVFDYFDEIRKITELAKTDILFVDPYLDAEFVSRYLQDIGSNIKIRLLARERLSSLVPAVEVLRQQTQQQIEIRSASGFHDRYIFIDQQECYQSGASFKDGAKKAPTTLTQIIDAFRPVLKTYEDIWASGVTA